MSDYWMVTDGNEPRAWFATEDGANYWTMRACAKRLVTWHAALEALQISRQNNPNAVLVHVRVVTVTPEMRQARIRAAQERGAWAPIVKAAVRYACKQANWYDVIRAVEQADPALLPRAK